MELHPSISCRSCGGAGHFSNRSRVWRALRGIALFQRWHLLRLLPLVALAASVPAQTPGSLDTTFGGTGRVTTSIHTLAECSAVLLQPDGKIVSAGTARKDGNHQFALLRQLPNGQADASFGPGGDGKVITSFGGGLDARGYAAALQADGKIIVTGYERNRIPVARYLPNGTLDPTFGSSGITLLSVGQTVPYAEGAAVAVAGDGKILLGGSLGGTLAVVRLLPDGTVDGSFGEGGVASSSGAIIKSLVVQPDGKILGAGNTFTGAGLFRWLANGAPDTSFGTGGMASLSQEEYDLIHSLALQADGKIVAAGVIGPVEYNRRHETRFIVARLTSTGQPDASFSGDGIVEIPLAGTGHEGRGIAVQADGHIVAGGYRRLGASLDREPVAVRLLPDGSPDASFGENGIALAGTASSRTEGRGLALAGNGRLLLGGPGSEDSIEGFQMICWRPDGRLDGTFGATGRVLIRVNGADSKARCMTLQPDGKILLAGESNLRMAVARYFADGRPDPSFGDKGAVIIAPATGYSEVHDVAVQPDGKILLAGDQSASQRSMALVRCLPDGSLDGTFGQGGKFLLTPPTGASMRGLSLALQPDGKILVGGERYDGSKSSFAVARVLAGGTLDESFGNAGLAVISFGSFDDDFQDLVLLPGGGIVIAGASAGSADVFNPLRRCALARLLPSGALDPAFGTGGKVLLDIPGENREEIHSLSLMPDGRLAAGLYASGGSVARFLGDGSLDLAFAGAGYTGAGIDDPGDVLALDDGSILACGGEAGDFHLAAFRPDGGLHSTFGTNGRSRVDFFTYGDKASALALQSGGGILVAGTAANAPGKGGFALARFHGFASALSPLQAWRQTHFGTSANEGDAADTADPDRDGVPNLVEFAAGSPPRSPQPSVVMPATPTGSMVEVSWSRNASRGSVTLTLQWSDTLAAGSWRADGLDTQTQPAVNGVERMLSRLPANPGGRRFFRLAAASTGN